MMNRNNASDNRRAMIGHTTSVWLDTPASRGLDRHDPAEAQYYETDSGQQNYRPSQQPSLNVSVNIRSEFLVQSAHASQELVEDGDYYEDDDYYDDDDYYEDYPETERQNESQYPPDNYRLPERDPSRLLPWSSDHHDPNAQEDHHHRSHAPSPRDRRVQNHYSPDHAQPQNSLPSQQPSQASNAPVSYFAGRLVSPQSTGRGNPHGPGMFSGFPPPQRPSTAAPRPPTHAAPGEHQTPHVRIKQEDEDEDLYSAPRTADILNRQLLLCDNCRRRGHHLSECIKLSASGDLIGCPFCQVTSHTIDQCPRDPPPTEHELFDRLVRRRACIGPIRTAKYSWPAMARNRPPLQDKSYPWTKWFAREWQARNPHVWRTYDYSRNEWLATDSRTRSFYDLEENTWLQERCYSTAFPDEFEGFLPPQELERRELDKREWARRDADRADYELQEDIRRQNERVDREERLKFLDERKRQELKDARRLWDYRERGRQDSHRAELDRYERERMAREREEWDRREWEKLERKRRRWEEDRGYVKGERRR
ncbi:hypothetical protein QBC35DRAFT_550969 [Podospora australis]|uniref:Zinc knuckle domain-containing protein n=1 Tax=Podospora australis TaxID=1536484 RepID=A0AAN6WWP2_9PEZI|nr:hypothetical protein QBC35DRAFT_550969 [Podospora australis]